MVLFEFINPFRNNNKIAQYLKENHALLLNKKEMIDYIHRAPRHTDRRASIRKTLSQSAKDRILNRVGTYKANLVDVFVSDMVKNICENIGDKYGEHSTRNAIEDDKYDILLVMDETYNEVDMSNKSPAQITRAKIAKILGFIIIQLGECVKYNDYITVNLICMRKGLKIKGTLLIGAYLYMLKAHRPEQHFGMLELADGHKNIAGLCAYGKFGFIQDPDLRGNDCFPELTNLPMSTDMEVLNKDTIIDIIFGRVVFDKHELCLNFGAVSGEDALDIIDREERQLACSNVYDSEYIDTDRRNNELRHRHDLKINHRRTVHRAKPNLRKTEIGYKLVSRRPVAKTFHRAVKYKRAMSIKALRLFTKTLGFPTQKKRNET